MVELYFDGTVRPSNDEAAVGLFSKNSEGEVTEKMYQIQAINNHEAEFIAFDKAVEWAHELIAQGERHFVSDGFRSRCTRSRTRIRQEQTNADDFDPAFARYQLLPLAFVKWIPRSENKADRVAREALRLYEA